MPPLMSGGGAAGRLVPPDRLPDFLPPDRRIVAARRVVVRCDSGRRFDLLHDDRLLADAAGAQEQVAEQARRSARSPLCLLGVAVVVGQGANGAFAPVAVDRPSDSSPGAEARSGCCARGRSPCPRPLALPDVPTISGLDAGDGALPRAFDLRCRQAGDLRAGAAPLAAAAGADMSTDRRVCPTMSTAVCRSLEASSICSFSLATGSDRMRDRLALSCAGSSTCCSVK